MYTQMSKRFLLLVVVSLLFCFFFYIYIASLHGYKWKSLGLVSFDLDPARQTEPMEVKTKRQAGCLHPALSSRDSL